MIPPITLVVMNQLDALSVLNGGLGAAYGAPTSPAGGRGFPSATSPGALDIYNSSQDSISYIQAATSPQSSSLGFPVSRGRVRFN